MIYPCSRLIETSSFPHDSEDRSPDRRCVKLRRILSPQAELSREVITSRTLIALFCREWSVPAGEWSRLLLLASKETRSPYMWRGVRDGLILDHSVGVLAPDPRPIIVVSIRGRSAWRAAGLDSARRWEVDVGESIGVNGPSKSGWVCGVIVPVGCSPSSKSTGSSTKISGTISCGTSVIRLDFLRSTARRNWRDQYRVSKKPMTVLRRTASCTRWSRARRRRNSSRRRLLLSLMTL